jgi:hypothetical protein
MTSAFAPDGFYPFEGPATISLELIPLSVRHKLDCAEVKLHLSQWQALGVDERALLVSQPCITDDEVRNYRELLNEMIDRHHAVPPTTHPLESDAPWRALSCWPRVIVDQCNNQSVALPPLDCWQSLSQADRHALFVLGRSRHSQAEFIGAMQLFFGV